MRKSPDIYLYKSKRLDIVFTKLYQPKHQGIYFYTPSIEIYSSTTKGLVIYFFFWLLEFELKQKQKG